MILWMVRWIVQWIIQTPIESGPWRQYCVVVSMKRPEGRKDDGADRRIRSCVMSCHCAGGSNILGLCDGFISKPSRTSFFLFWSVGREGSPFLRQSPPWRAGGRQSSNGPNAPRRTPSFPFLGTELISLSSLFAEMKIIAAVARSVPFLFFLYYPSSNFWLALPRSQEGE